MTDYPVGFPIEVVRGSDYDRTITWWAGLPSDAAWLLDDWDADRPFRFHDVVEYAGARYLALEANQGAQPDTSTAQWEALSPVDLTDFTALLRVRKGPGSPVKLDLVGGSGLSLGGTAGTIRIRITAADTLDDAFPVAGCYQHGLFLTAPGVGGQVTELLDGEFRVKASTA